MIAFLILVGIVTGACALVVLADYFAPPTTLRGMFGTEPDYLAPWRDREPGDLDG